MRARSGVCDVVVFCVALVAGGTAHVGADTTPPESELVPAYTRLVLDNGITLLLLEHHELPLVDFEFVFRTGSVADPAGREGLADVTMALLRKGTKKRKAAEIAEELDFLGGELDFGALAESCNMTAQFLAKDVEAGLDLMADILLHPTFPEDELRKLLDLRVDQIREAKDNPRRVIRNYYEGFLFQGHPFSRPVGGTEESLPAITRTDVVRFHAASLRPNNLILAVAGDFDTDRMRARIESALGSWARRDVTAPPLPEPEPTVERHVLLVDKPDAVQTYFYIGNVGVAKGHLDTAVLDVVNTIFGGRFTSWLQNELRTKAGLTYSAYARFVERSVAGPFFIASFTRVETTEQAVDLALEILERLHMQGISREELESARNYIRGQFPPRYETAGELAAAMAELEFYGLDRSYINDHTAKTDAVTLDQVREAIRVHYPREDLTFVFVGQAETVRPIASKYGKLESRSITEPGF